MITPCWRKPTEETDIRSGQCDDLHAAHEKAKKDRNTCLFDIKTIPGTMTGNYDGWWRVGTAQISAHKAVEEAAALIKEELKKVKQY